MSDYCSDTTQRNAVLSEAVSQLSAAGPEQSPRTSATNTHFISFLDESAKNVVCVRISIPVNQI